MTKTTPLTIAVLVCLLALSVSASDEKPWFDMENCVFCKHIAEDMEIIEHMSTKYHIIEEGALSVTVVDPEWKDKMLAMQKKMQETGEKMMTGTEMPPMCRHCATYGELLMAGAHMERVDSEAGQIVLWTSEDPELVAKIRAFAQRTNAEMEKFMAEYRANK